MKHVMLALVLIAGIVGCGSDKTTDTFVPIDPAWLIGPWAGNYALTYDAGTDSARTYEVEIQIVFNNTWFNFSGDQILNCETFGGGGYQIRGNVLEFEDQLTRVTNCNWDNILQGQFTYNYGSRPLELHMTQSFGGLHWQVDLVKLPRFVVD